MKLKIIVLTALAIAGCQSISTPVKIKVLTGSALGQFCQEAARNFNQTNPKLENETSYQIECASQGSGDAIGELESLVSQLESGTLPPGSDKFPALISLDGEIYQNQLIERSDRAW